MSDENNAKADVPNGSVDQKSTKDGVEKTTSPLNGSEATRELTTKEAYFQALNAWVKNANSTQMAISMFPWYMVNSYPQMFQNPTAGFGMSPLLPMGLGAGVSTEAIYQSTINSNNGATQAVPAGGAANGMRAAGQQQVGLLRILDEQTQADIINRNGGFEYTIAPFWKRAVAEAIDVLILLVLKLVVTFILMNIFDLDVGFDMDKEVIRKAINDDDYASFLNISLDFLAFSSDLLLLEFVTKIVVCMYEAVWTTWYHGSTPGKALLNLRIQYCEAVLLLAPPAVPQMGFQIQRTPMRALIYPAETPGFVRAFIRAVIKNVIVTLLFPMCFVMAFFKHNRTAYDIITKTVVVESTPHPVLRFQR